MSESELPPGANPDFAVSPPLVGPSWQEQDGVLSDLWRQNKTPQEISAVLGRSVGAIMTRAARLGLPRRSAPGRKPGSRRIDENGVVKTNTGNNSTSNRRVASSAREGEEVISQASMRICLMCLRSFQSAGRHNRICTSCKGSSDYAAAASTADIHFPV